MDRHVVPDPRRALPLSAPPAAFLLIAFFLLLPSTLAAQFQADSSLGSDALWEPLFPWYGFQGTEDNPGNAWIEAMAPFGDAMVVYGGFQAVDGVPADRFAMLEDGRWRSMGPDTPTGVDRLVEWNGSLIAGGNQASGDTTWRSLFHRWTPESGWESFGPAVAQGGSFDVQNLVPFRGGLAVVVDGYTPHGDDVTMALLWDGMDWRDISPPSDSSDFTTLHICQYQGDLFLHRRSYREQERRSDFFRWDGETWSSLTVPLDGSVMDLLAVEDHLFVYGYRTEEDGTARRLLQWDGTEWLQVPEPPGGAFDIDGLQALGKKLFVIGSLRPEGGRFETYRGLWDGTSWERLPDSGFWPDGDLATDGNGRLWGYDHDSNHLFVLDGTSAWNPVPDWGLHPVASSRFVFLPRAADLLLGCAFQPPGRVPPTVGILRWDGATWSVLAEGFDGSIACLKEYRGELLAGGEFDSLQGAPLRGVARLTEGGWKPLGDGIEFYVYDLAAYGTRLMAAGYAIPNEQLHPRIRAWDGARWSDLGDGLVGWARSVYDLQVYDGSLWVGGRLAWAGGQRIMTLTRWDGYSWKGTIEQDPFPAEYSTVCCLHEWKGRLLAIGESYDSSVLRAWDGAAWSMPDSLHLDVYSVTEHEGRLVFVGEGEWPDSRGAKVVEWDGRTWWSPGSGVRTGGSADPRGRVTTAAVWKGDLYVAGDFDVAGGRPAQSVAVFRDSTKARAPEPALLIVGPNPAFQGPVSLSLLVTDPGPVSLCIVDVAGREVRRIVDGPLPGGEHAFSWDLRDDRGREVASGIYFVAARTDAGAFSRRIVVVWR